MADDAEERMVALEAKVETLYRVMAQAAEAVKDVRHRIDEEGGRSGASLIIATALVQALGRVAPDVLNGMIRHIDRVEEDLAKTEGGAATVSELAAFREGLKGLRQEPR